MTLKVVGNILIKNVINFSTNKLLLSNFDNRIYENGLGELTIDEKGILLIDAGHVNVGCSLQATSLQSNYINDQYTTSPPSTLIGDSTSSIRLFYENPNPLRNGPIVILSSISVRITSPLIILDELVINNRAAGSDLLFNL